jgi:hypothetical protein
VQTSSRASVSTIASSSLIAHKVSGYVHALPDYYRPDYSSPGILSEGS